MVKEKDRILENVTYKRMVANFNKNGRRVFLFTNARQCSVSASSKEDGRSQD